ncbi:hypothetical protein [Terrihalobacillus insolitus]|uniref:hypothetical protein n=1 Tax=Terrihalobacillus insolitus TaxID=2950438 RepID=UPI002341C0D8|nr:hypothetical protein [Terrihalobacillus insolitus]MDC3411838.1 hypothetical protein [Terrihalobacillus insolitus]
MESNLTHFAASDAHNTTTRGLTMQEANQFIGDTYGNEMVCFFMENAQFCWMVKRSLEMFPNE